MSSQNNLEPRVAKVETGLEMLTRDVSNLVQVVRDQGNSIEQQIRDLAIGVTQAAAPKKTDWQTLIALLMLVMAIGSAVFWPLNQSIHRLETQVADEIKAAQTGDDKQNAIWENKISTLHEQINMRLNKLETHDEERIKADLDELRVLRQRFYTGGGK